MPNLAQKGLGSLCMLPVLQQLGDAYSFELCNTLYKYHKNKRDILILQLCFWRGFGLGFDPQKIFFEFTNVHRWVLVH